MGTPATSGNSVVRRALPIYLALLFALLTGIAILLLISLLLVTNRMRIRSFTLSLVGAEHR